VLLRGTAVTSVEDSVGQLLTQAEQQKAAAMKSGLKDFIEWFDRWLADDFVFTGANSQVNAGRKAEALKGLAASDWTYESVSLDDLKVHTFGDSAVVTAIQTERHRPEAKDGGGRFQFTHVYVRRNGRWQIIAGHSTRLS
jgi:hypothetical protein